MAADNKKILYGGDLMIFIGTGATTEPFAFSTSAKLDISLKTLEISSKDSGYWTSIAAGKFTWNISTDGLMSYTLTSGNTNSVDELWTMMLTRTVVNVVFAAKTGTSPSWTIDSSKKKFSGTALITSLSLNANDNEMATYSITLEGSEELTMA